MDDLSKKKDCWSCARGRLTYDGSCVPGFEGGCSQWEPVRNIDRVHEMTREELIQMFGITKFPDKYIPDGCELNCEWIDFECGCCPNTFGNWLDAEVE